MKRLAMFLAIVLLITGVVPVNAGEIFSPDLDTGYINEVNEAPELVTPSQFVKGCFQASRYAVIGGGSEGHWEGVVEVAYVSFDENIYHQFSGTPYDDIDKYNKSGWRFPFAYDYSHDDWIDIQPYYADRPVSTSERVKIIPFTASISNNYTVSVPELYIEGFRHVGWFASNDERIFIETGKPYTFKESELRDPDFYNSPSVVFNQYGYTFYPVFEMVSNEAPIEGFSFEKDGHTVSASINRTPQYTGSKIKAGDIFEKIEIDGTAVDPYKIKLSVSKGKDAGSNVSVKLKKVKGFDKSVNRSLKGLDFGSVTIIPALIKQVVPKTKVYSEEGQAMLDAKEYEDYHAKDGTMVIQDDDVKAVYLIVSKNGKYSFNNKKMKKIKLRYQKEWGQVGGDFGDESHSSFQCVEIYGKNARGIVLAEKVYRDSDLNIIKQERYYK